MGYPADFNTIIMRNIILQPGRTAGFSIHPYFIKGKLSMICYQYLDTFVGKLLICGTEKGITTISFPKGQNYEPDKKWKEKPECFKEAVRQLELYFDGKLRHFSLALILKGTVFQMKAWNVLMKIPYGQTMSYKDVAEKIGSPKAARAVGGAAGKNPIPIIIPCHRVIGSDGKLGGFGGGPDVKAALLELERKYCHAKPI